MAVSAYPAALAAERLDFLALLTPDLREELLAGSVPSHVPAGSLLYQPGQEPMDYLVTEGLVRAFFASTDGREVTLGFAHAAELAGLIPMPGRPLELYLQTVTPTSTLRISDSRLMQLASQNPLVGLAVARNTAQMLRKAFHRLAVASLGNVQERLSCDLLERACHRQLTAGRLDVRVSHAELAASIGTSREAVTRAMTALRSQGFVTTVRERVSLLDPEGLAAVHSGFTV